MSKELGEARSGWVCYIGLTRDMLEENSCER